MNPTGGGGGGGGGGTGGRTDGGGVRAANDCCSSEVAIDPGIGQPRSQAFSEQVIEGRRTAHPVYVGLHIPAGGRRHSHRKLKHSVGAGGSSSSGMSMSGSASTYQSGRDGEKPVTPPAQRVQFILGEDLDGDGDARRVAHPLFSEMEELVRTSSGDSGDQLPASDSGGGCAADGTAGGQGGQDFEWKETARWVKFEEDVEEGGNRWSKPHVATLSLHSLFQLRQLLNSGTVMLDMEATSLEEVTGLLCDSMCGAGLLTPETRGRVQDVLMRRHRHQHESGSSGNGRRREGATPISRLPIIRSLAEIGRNHSSSKNAIASSAYSLHASHSASAAFDEDASHQHPHHPAAAPQQISMLSPSYVSRDQRGSYLTVPTGDDMIKSPSSSGSMHRCNTSSNDLAFEHKGNTHFMKKIPHGAEASNILVGEVDFLDRPLSAFIRLNEGTVMGDLTEVPLPTRFLFILLGPPGSPGSYHEIGRAMATLMSDEIFHEVAYRARRRDHLLSGIDEFLDAVTVLPPGEWDPAIRIEPPAAVPSQVERKRPPADKNVVPDARKEAWDEEQEEERLRAESGLARSGRLFGGLMDDLRRKRPWYWSDFRDAMSVQCVASWIFLYFACLSPIITFGGLLSEATGKNMAAMESLVSGFVCGLGYGLFSGQPLTILGSTGPVLVFETIVYDFCAQTGLDYMSFRFWIGTWITVILVILVAVDASALVCYITRFTEENFATLIAFIFVVKAVENVMSIRTRFPVNPPTSYDCACTNGTVSLDDWLPYDREQCGDLGGSLLGMDCDQPPYKPNVFLMSLILFIGTFLISVVLKDFKNARFFPTKVRQFISDFSVIIAIFSMTILDFKCGIDTPKLEVPAEFKPTLPGRDWIISPLRNPVWSWAIAVLPAILGTILIFMDQQITAVIVNRKENKLKKGCGYHLDLFVLALLIQVCTVLGLPWFVAATVLSINHVNSLKLESECAAPGEKPQFLGVREQRVTHIFIFLMIGGSVLLTPLLSHIPMPVLFGVFLYMGVASLKGLQFFDRILIMFMPAKYQPDFMFLRQVPIRRVHLFTLIQFVCLVCLWLIKSFPQTSILFPLMLIVMIGIRKSLDTVFTRRELKILDDIMPEMSRKAAAEEDLDRLEGAGGAGGAGAAAGAHLEDPPPKYSHEMVPAISVSEERRRSNGSAHNLQAAAGGGGGGQRISLAGRPEATIVRLSVMPEEAATDGQSAQGRPSTFELSAATDSGAATATSVVLNANSSSSSWHNGQRLAKV